MHDIWELCQQNDSRARTHSPTQPKVFFFFQIVLVCINIGRHYEAVDFHKDTIKTESHMCQCIYVLLIGGYKMHVSMHLSTIGWRQMTQTSSIFVSNFKQANRPPPSFCRTSKRICHAGPSPCSIQPILRSRCRCLASTFCLCHACCA